MKDLRTLLGKYQAKITITPGVSTELTIAPENTEGCVIVLHGSFDRDPLERCQITTFAIDGFWEDVRDDYIDEDLYYAMTQAVLTGNYKYELRTETLRDRLLRGSIYLTIGTKEKKLLSSYRCVNQKKMKRLFKQGLLRSRAYDLKSQEVSSELPVSP